MDAGASLDFIGDERIRKSLTRDLEELDRAFEFRLWKSTHVIAGSVIEAILIDGLLNTGGINMTVENILKLDLGSAIKLCKEHKIVSERSEQLSTVIKDYRNLIHPGRVIRLEESVEENTAQIAVALTRIILSEVGDKLRGKTGYSAASLANKIEQDESSIDILPILLSRMNTQEINQLVATELPNRYIRYLKSNEKSEHFLPHLSKCFRLALKSADSAALTKYAQSVVDMIKNSNRKDIENYITTFFNITDIAFLADDQDKELVKTWIFTNFSSSPNDRLLAILSGLNTVVTIDDVPKILSPLLRIAFGTDPDYYDALDWPHVARFRDACRDFIAAECGAAILDEILSDKVLAITDSFISGLSDEARGSAESLREELAMPF